MDPELPTENKRRLCDEDIIFPREVPAAILSIPPAALTNIIKMLDVQGKKQVAQVCRSWRDAAKLEKVWCNTWVALTVNAVEQDTCAFLASRGVRKIELTNNDHAMRSLMPAPMPPAMLSTLPGLTHLVLSHSLLIGDGTVLLICQAFKELISLQLGGRFSSSSITNASIGYICDGLKKLERLTVRLHLKQPVTDAGMKQLADSDLPLRFLGLHDFRLLTDESLQYLSFGKPDLEGLEMIRCSLIRCFKYVSTMKKLRYLKLEDMQLTNHCWRAIASMLSLRTLILFSLKNENFNFGVHALWTGKSQIEKLILDQFQTITNNSMKYLAAMRHLRQLSISNSDLLNQKGLMHLIWGNKQLISLDIINCRGLRMHRALESITASQANLQRLHLQSRLYRRGYAMRIDEDFLSTMAQELPYLTYLHVDGKNLIQKLRVKKYKEINII